MLPLRDELPTRRMPVVTYALIAVNVVVFLLQWSLRGTALTVELGLVPARLLSQPLTELVTVPTSMFMHAGLAHLGGNMLFLWIFGDNVEDALGRGRYLGFYLLSGVVAAAAQVAIHPLSMIPMVGASGAIAGVLAAYGSLYPSSPIVVLNPIPLLWIFMGPLWRLPAWLVILEFFVLNLLSGMVSLGNVNGGGVAFFAHLGGFVAGLVLVRLMLPKDHHGNRHDPWKGWRPPPRRPGPREWPPPDDWPPRRREWPPPDDWPSYPGRSDRWH